MQTLTARQNEIYQWLRWFIRKNSCSPTVREIAAKFEIASPNGVVVSLNALEKKEYITRRRNESRGIRLVGGLRGPGKCPLCGGKLT